MKLITTRHLRYGLLAGSALLPLLFGAAQAQDESATPADTTEVVVTATRKSTALSKVPVSVAAYTQEKLDQQGVRDINDLARITPGVRLTSMGGSDIAGNGRNISIRGISSGVGSATTGIYLDDTPIQVRKLGNATSNFYPSIFDLERVEVLRGPQGTLFGAGAEGGTVRFLTPQPSLSTYSVYARSEVGFTDGGNPSYEAGIAVGGPIIEDVLGFRISTYYRRDGGFVDRVDPKTFAAIEDNANSADGYATRAALAWQMTPRLKGTLSIYTQKQDSNGSSFFAESLSDPENGRFISATARPTTSEDNLTIPSLSLEYKGDSFDIISTTSSLNRKVERDVDYSNFIATLLLKGPFNYLAGETSSALINDSQHDLTQELRIQSNSGGKLTWVFGGFYSKSKQYSNQVNVDPAMEAALIRTYGVGTAAVLGQPLADGYSLFITDAATTDEQKALFGQIDYELLTGLKLTVGVRAADISLEAERVSRGPVAGAGVSFTESQSEKPVTPKFGLSYQMDKNTLVYASAAKGFRIGGINGPGNAFCASSLAAIGLSNSPVSYESDSVWSYELGAKTKFMDGRLSVDSSVFNIDWDNIQTGISLSNCGSGFVTNLGKAKSTGFDIAANWKLTDNLVLGGSIGYADARSTETVAGATSSTIYVNDGTKIGGPPWSWGLNGDYSFTVLNTDAYARVDYQHTGEGIKMDYTVAGADKGLRPTKAWDVVSLRSGMRMNGIDASLYVNNLFNDAPILSRRRDTATSTLFFDTTVRPRTVGVTVSYRY